MRVSEMFWLLAIRLHEVVWIRQARPSAYRVDRKMPRRMPKSLRNERSDVCQTPSDLFESQVAKATAQDLPRGSRESFDLGAYAPTQWIFFLS